MDYEQLVQDTTEAISAAIEANVQLLGALRADELSTSNLMALDLTKLLVLIGESGYALKEVRNVVKLGEMSENALYSLDRITSYIEKNEIQLAINKTTYELYPILRDVYAEFYFWTCVYPDQKKMQTYYDKELSQFYKQDYIEEAEKTGHYKYDLSVCVVGYNKSDYTKSCVRSLLDNMPQDINYELILYNHGSSDDTQYFFESINPHKQIDIKINGVQKAVVYFTIEGEYFLGISNDVIITPNSVSNMLRALKSDNSIGFIVPSTPNISNFQTISAPYYMYMDELSKWSLENNVYDEFRHEQRVRLCNPLWMAKSRSLSADHGIGFTGRYFTDGDRMAATFPDDLMSMLMRRNSLKNILMKDAYCHHFGSITIGNDLKKKQTNQALMYANGRRDFKNMFGIDPWGTGFCYDPELYIKNGFECKFDGHIEILGINCGLGSNSLKIKELYKERKHNLDVRLTNATDDRSFEGDLRGVSDNVRIVKKAAEVFSESDIKYHHIVVEDAFNIHINTSKFITLCLSHLVENGTLCIKFTDLKELKKVAERYKDTKIINNWVMILNSLRRLPV